MIREIVKPTKNTYTLNLPDEMIGKMVEVIAFEIDKSADINDISSGVKNSVDDIKQKYSKYPSISHKNYRFDRDDANTNE